MEAQITNASLPLIVSLRVRFRAGESEKFFDFSFREYSKEPGQTHSLRVHWRRRAASCDNSRQSVLPSPLSFPSRRRSRPYRVESRLLFRLWIPSIATPLSKSRSR